MQAASASPRDRTNWATQSLTPRHSSRKPRGEVLQQFPAGYRKATTIDARTPSPPPPRACDPRPRQPPAGVPASAGLPCGEQCRTGRFIESHRVCGSWEVVGLAEPRLGLLTEPAWHTSQYRVDIPCFAPSLTCLFSGQQAIAPVAATTAAWLSACLQLNCNVVAEKLADGTRATRFAESR